MTATTAVPADPLIFHITHVDNLPEILRQGGLWCDSQRIAKKLPTRNIAHLHIKTRRLNRPVMTRADGKLGDYVPFNFCSRSVMLYVVHQGHQDYAGGQEDVVHLVSSVARAVALGRPWAFSDRHAELGHSLHYDDLARLDEVRWDVMGLQYWRDVKEERQAEFLVHDFFPWQAITEIGVMAPALAGRVTQLLSGASHRPPVAVRPGWYY